QRGKGGDQNNRARDEHGKNERLFRENPFHAFVDSQGPKYELTSFGRKLNQLGHRTAGKVENSVAPSRFQNQNGKHELQSKPPQDRSPREQLAIGGKRPGHRDEHDESEQADQSELHERTLDG